MIFGTYGRRSTWFRFTGVPKKDMADATRLNPMPHVPYLGSVLARDLSRTSGLEGFGFVLSARAFRIPTGSDSTRGSEDEGGFSV